MNRITIIALLSALAAAPALAADDAFEFFREEAKVSSASRRLEPVWQAPVAVDVITAEEIREFGWSTIPDMLRFRAGMDVVEGRSADGNRSIVSARGFSRDFVAEMQVLVDGRSVYSPFLGGVYWESIPVQIQDIERVEIVRGPNAALYGSNSALGVVNIITRRPSPPPSGRLAARGGTGGWRTAESAEAGGRKGALRLSHVFDSRLGNLSPDGSSEANDFLHSNKLGVRGLLDLGPDTRLELLGGGAWQTQGIPGFSPDQRSTRTDDFQMLRGERRLDSGGSVEAAASRTGFLVSASPLAAGTVDVRTYQYDAEVLHRSEWAEERVKSVLGAGWRLGGAYSDQTFAGHPAQQNETTRAFTHHSVKLTEKASAAAGVSVERSQTGGLQPSWQAAAIYAFRPSQSFRASYSRASTLPPLFNKYGDYRVSAPTRIVGNPDLAPQRLSSWEAGWSGLALDDALKASVALYYMEVADRNFAYVLAPGAPSVVTYDNRNRAAARGVEASGEYALGAGRELFANYTFERLLDDKGPTDAFRTDISRGSPVHKANAGFRGRLARGFSAAAALGYKDAYDANSSTRGTRRPIARSFRLDARLSWSPRADWTAFVAGSDLLQPYRVEWADGSAVPRRFEAGLIRRFGL